MNRTGFVVVYNDAGQAGLQDADGRQVVPCRYDKILDYDDDGYIRVLKGGVYGTLDLDCREVIPHSVGLTHLGVFHKGTARAVKDGMWGLVDEKGAEASDFCFMEIKAHRKWGYDAVSRDGTSGILSEDGTFTPGKRKTPKRQYRSVRVFHNDIAPACTWADRWVFVDRDLNRVNDYEYYGMDPVLRHGIYSIFWAPSSFGAAFYDGRPVIEERYDYPLHFENGLAVTQKKRRDADGREVFLANGQPQYDMGILKDTGDYLFPPVYHELHWNDYGTKDCWYAEDGVAAYLLFPDGTRRAYDKRLADRTWPLPSIPAANRDKYMSEAELAGRYMPQEICCRSICRFSRKQVFDKLYWWTGSSAEPQQFFYRDTDAPIRVRKHYKTGAIVRCGSMMEVTPALLRPVHKYRFLIVTRKVIETRKVSELFQGRCRSHGADAYILHKNSFFMVYDVYRYAGVTQIALLQLPCGFTKLARAEGIGLKMLKDCCPNLKQLREQVRCDLHDKMSEKVHGCSLSEEWEAKMCRPVGLTDDLVSVAPEKETVSGETCSGYPDHMLDSYYDICMDDRENAWRRNLFMDDTFKTVKVVAGDIARLDVDAIVDAAGSPLEGEGGVDSAVGECTMTDACQLPCRKIIHTAGPMWQGGGQGEAELLARCYESALRLAEEHGIGSVAFPCIGTGMCRFPEKEAARIALDTIRKVIGEGTYSGDVVLCCLRKEEAAICGELLESQSWAF